MRVAFGIKVHSGWASLVALGRREGGLVVADRRLLVLVEDEWAKHAYHAAQKLTNDAGRDRIARTEAVALRLASRALREALGSRREAGDDVAASALLTGAPMPGWTLQEIVAVHFRMHQAEGVLFREALARGAAACGLRVVEIPGKTLEAEAAKTLGSPAPDLIRRIAALRAEAGPPWGKDQKDAALAALIALEGDRSRRPRAGVP